MPNQVADALEAVPYTLAENAGLVPIDVVSELRSRHAAGEAGAGVDARRGVVPDMAATGVVQPLAVTRSALTLAAECVRMILKIDDVIMPHGTRRRICRALATLETKKLENPWRKHGTIPL